MKEDKLTQIAGQFIDIEQVDRVSPLGEGFINDTFLIYPKAEGQSKLLLQRKNKNIFINIPAMMENINLVTKHLKTKIKAQGGDPEREVLTLVTAKDGKFYYMDEADDYWTACLFIEPHQVIETVDNSSIAYSGGKGVGRFQAMLADFEGELTDILPGFHDIKFRFDQWDKVLAEDRVGRKAEVLEEIEWIESRRAEMLDYWKLVEEGQIPRRITHNDTKISNILFDLEGDVLCMIDLDTVSQSPASNDFGDAIRSYSNTAVEDEPDLSKVSMNLERYREFTRGYLEEAGSFLNEKELEYLPFSAKYITYEQVLRFLMDYIDGDRYYKTKSEDHNLVRTRSQYKLLQSMEEQYAEMQQLTKEFVS
ncbi:phosphotransferase enzyme family protein [Sunxiuqinia elliptica]|uniref:Phosphotransferase enzyme family protein n=1 Tax=Sunxiuqinia elliptica TaxID=655355 RepID=A0A1I2M1Q9_9BACT|nr:aminoglycoside phosphotransferase family protein [Sunxiuqinia elliptica]SFF85455.1 Phosphotransferase enzyme family protein [Sunxiuqinia elliptica]